MQTVEFAFIYLGYSKSDKKSSETQTRCAGTYLSHVVWQYRGWG